MFYWQKQVTLQMMTEARKAWKKKSKKNQREVVSNKNEWEGRERMKSRKSLYVTAAPAESASLLNRRHETKTRVYATSSLLPSPSFLACSHSQVSSLSLFLSLTKMLLSGLVMREACVVRIQSRVFHWIRTSSDPPPLLQSLVLLLLFDERLKRRLRRRKTSV